MYPEQFPNVIVNLWDIDSLMANDTDISEETDNQIPAGFCVISINFDKKESEE
jgi:hypothetical protein